MLTLAVPPCRSCKYTPPPPPAPLPESSPVASRCLGVGAPELRRVITACSPCAHHAVTPSGAGWLLMFIPGRPMCSFLLILSLGSTTSRVGATIGSRLMTFPPLPSPHGLSVFSQFDASPLASRVTTLNEGGRGARGIFKQRSPAAFWRN